MSESLDYRFLAPSQITFGWGRRREVGPMARGLGRRAFVMATHWLAGGEVLAGILAALRSEGVEAVLVATATHEPEVADVDRAAAAVREHGAKHGDLILAVGGGSTIDLGKAVAAMATNCESPTVRDYLEGVGSGLSLVHRPLAVLAMPTTAGTGTEATKNAVISCYDPPFKKSLRSDFMVPRAVLIDPELTTTVPPNTTAQTGMDAVTQLIESYVSRRRQPIPQALALHGLRLAASALVEAVRDGASRTARERMSHAALLSGMALANSGLGMAHGVAAALGVVCRVPHGLACAVMLPAALRANRAVCAAEFSELATAMTGRTYSTVQAGVDALIEAVDALCQAVGVPRRLGQVGARPDQIPELVRGSRGASMSGNPRDLSDSELRAILEDML
ncbi:MAG: iron-containing alcohol dehydrogenase [Pirellulales bacterium]